MDLTFIAVALPLLLVAFVFARMAWRLVWRNEQPEAGGSYGRQIRKR